MAWATCIFLVTLCQKTKPKHLNTSIGLQKKAQMGTVYLTPHSVCMMGQEQKKMCQQQLHCLKGQEESLGTSQQYTEWVAYHFGEKIQVVAFAPPLWSIYGHPLNMDPGATLFGAASIDFCQTTQLVLLFAT